MTAFAGHIATVSASTNGSVWTAVGEMNSVEVAIGGTALDVTKFGDADVERILGLRDTPWTLGGFYDPTDAGQAIISTALLTNGPLYLQVQFNPAGTSGQKGFSQAVVCTKFDIKGDPANAQTLSISCDSTGAITQV